MNRQTGIDLARMLAAYLVLFGHFLLSGTFGTDDSVKQWAGPGEPLPLLQKSSYVGWELDSYMLGHWHTACAIVGVALFFLISGWLVPPMLHNYTRLQFLKNRIFRIFPMLMVSVLVAALLQYFFGDGAALRWQSILSTFFIVNQITTEPLSLGVVWTLIIECKFFLLLLAVGKLDQRRIIVTSLALSAVNLMHFGLVTEGAYIERPYLLDLMNATAHDIHYLIFMLVSASLWLVIYKDEQPSVTRRLFWPIIVLVIFNLDRILLTHNLHIHPKQDIGFITQIIVGGLFGICLWTQHRRWLSGRAAAIVSSIAAFTYSLYLLHVPLGFLLLSRLRHQIDNSYLLLLLVILLVSLAAAICYRLIELPAHQWARNFKRNPKPVFKKI